MNRRNIHRCLSPQELLQQQQLRLADATLGPLQRLVRHRLAGEPGDRRKWRESLTPSDGLWGLLLTTKSIRSGVFALFERFQAETWLEAHGLLRYLKLLA